MMVFIFGDLHLIHLYLNILFQQHQSLIISTLVWIISITLHNYMVLWIPIGVAIKHIANQLLVLSSALLAGPRPRPNESLQRRKAKANC